ncbi:MAG: aminotransferase class V-fold PLP-dependent enzyme [Acidobacteriia bacterium]|nr:aminotransferase class V-fold PLP-dependent enzyme [Terriglobia bacterium]
MSIDWNQVRAEFPALENYTYLNSATYGQMPRRGADALVRHLDDRNEKACSNFLDWYGQIDQIRASIAQLIHAEAEDIAFVPNAATALGLVVGGIDWKPGENVVTLADEFPNMLYIPALVERRGVELREVPWEKFYDAIDERTRLVAISEVNYATSLRPPLAEISKFAHERDVTFFVDGTQSVGALQCDVRESRPDMMAVHGYKWMCSPTGAGFMYVAPELRKKLPPAVAGWRSHRDWRNVDNLHHGMPVLEQSAERYEGGGLPMGLLHAMGAMVDWMLELGPAAIEQRVLGLARAARERLRRLGGESTDTGAQIAAVKFAGADPSHLARELRSKRVLVAARHGFLRISPHFYNNEADLDRLEEELRKLL